MRLLLVEDDARLADALERALHANGLAVDREADGARADAVLRTEHYALVVLDLNLPGLDGVEVLRRLRARGAEVPVLVLTARGQLDDRVRGLDCGADDYLTKPFDLPELEARVRALIRRGQGRHQTRIEHGPLVLDTVGRTVLIDGRRLDLPRRELCLLEVLLGRAGEVIAKDRIADALYGFDDPPGPNAIEIYVHRLRRKLEPHGVNIRTVRGLGYLLERP